jgi:hypothetical protein
MHSFIKLFLLIAYADLILAQSSRPPKKWKLHSPDGAKVHLKCSQKRFFKQVGYSGKCDFKIVRIPGEFTKDIKTWVSGLKPLDLIKDCKEYQRLELKAHHGPTNEVYEIQDELIYDFKRVDKLRSEFTQDCYVTYLDKSNEEKSVSLGELVSTVPENLPKLCNSTAHAAYKNIVEVKTGKATGVFHTSKMPDRLRRVCPEGTRQYYQIGRPPIKRPRPITPRPRPMVRPMPRPKPMPPTIQQ